MQHWQPTLNAKGWVDRDDTTRIITNRRVVLNHQYVDAYTSVLRPSVLTLYVEFGRYARYVTRMLYYQQLTLKQTFYCFQIDEYYYDIPSNSVSVQYVNYRLSPGK